MHNNFNSPHKQVQAAIGMTKRRQAKGKTLSYDDYLSEVLDETRDSNAEVLEALHSSSPMVSPLKPYTTPSTPTLGKSRSITTAGSIVKERLAALSSAKDNYSNGQDEQVGSTRAEEIAEVINFRKERRQDQVGSPPHIRGRQHSATPTRKKELERLQRDGKVKGGIKHVEERQAAVEEQRRQASEVLTLLDQRNKLSREREAMALKMRQMKQKSDPEDPTLTFPYSPSRSESVLDAARSDISLDSMERESCNDDSSSSSSSIIEGRGGIAGREIVLKVYARIRPTPKLSPSSSSQCIILSQQGEQLLVGDPHDLARAKSFAFDKVFREDDGQDQFFSGTGSIR